MKTFTQTFMTYNPNEFTPVYREGVLDVKVFAGYKAKTIGTHIANKIDTFFTRPL